jgi:hypothetical protein
MTFDSLHILRSFSFYLFGDSVVLLLPFPDQRLRNCRDAINKMGSMKLRLIYVDATKSDIFAKDQRKGGFTTHITCGVERRHVQQRTALLLARLEPVSNGLHLACTLCWRQSGSAKRCGLSRRRPPGNTCFPVLW